jgi:hypothetical protein
MRHGDCSKERLGDWDGTILVQLVRLLLAVQADGLARNSDYTPLHFAAALQTVGAGASERLGA